MDCLTFNYNHCALLFFFIGLSSLRTNKYSEEQEQCVLLLSYYASGDILDLIIKTVMSFVSYKFSHL